MRDDPSLRGKALAVGGSPDKRGVVATCSYEARAYGVRSAMAMRTALKLCPDLLVVRPRFDVYRAVSKQIHAIFRDYTDLIEPLSLDEAYLDVSASPHFAGSATRSVQGLDEDIGFLPGTEAEKMEPWLGAITDNLEALHMDDECTHGSVDYILSKVPLQFKSLNYIRGRSFQQSLILIDECQNLTPHQMKTIITRAGSGSKVICLGNLAQIDTPYLSATSSGLTYLTERFKDFPHGVHVTLQGVPRSVLAEYAEAHM